MKALLVLAFAVFVSGCATSNRATAPSTSPNPAPAAPAFVASANASTRHKSTLGPVDASEPPTSEVATAPEVVKTVETPRTSNAATSSDTVPVHPFTAVVPNAEPSVQSPPAPPPSVAARVEAPPTGPVQLQPGALVRGPGPAPNPAAEPVKGHAVLPVWDDAIGPRPPAVSLVWGQSAIALNLYEPPHATPMQVEFSLDGGPWLAARYGRVMVPDLGVGSYQVRCVAFPSRGKTWVMEPIVLERTATGWRTK